MILRKPLIIIKLYESVDISRKAQLIAFVHFINANEIVNQFLSCKELIKHTIEKHIFNCIATYLEKSKISCDFCVGICTDEVP